MKIFYIHGFGSSPNSDTRKLLSKYFKQEVVGLTYDYEWPAFSVESLGTQIQFSVDSEKEVLVIGSSLGGFFAEQLTDLLPQAKYILYNPSLNPAESLKKYSVPKEVLDFYWSPSEFKKSYTTVSRTVILSVDDEVIDYRAAQEYYYKTSNVILTKGGHRMTDGNARLIAERGMFVMNQFTGDSSV